MLLDRSLPSPRAQAPALGRARLTLSLGSWVALTLSSCGSDHGTADDMNAIAELDASSADAHVGGDPLDGALHASDATHGLDAGVHEQPQQDGSAGHSADSGQGHTADYCLSAEPPDPRDKMLSGQPEPWLASTGEIDLVLPKPVLDWMDERIWKPSHDAWHNIRRCDHGGFSGIPLSAVDFSICVNRVLIPEDQECENPSDGYQFLVMHRHMIQSLKQAFPEHAQLFEGFPSFPYQATDVPEQWRDRWGTGWAPAILASADTLENIEQNLSQFASEGELGQFIQCGSELDGVHGALHFKWVVNESPNSLGKQTVNIGNYMFWKLHGWIDRIWERYRIAKGLTPDEPKLRDELVEQCREMHALGQVIDPSADPPTSDPLPDEAGFFHESVRPILDRRCSGCHSEGSSTIIIPEL